MHGSKLVALGYGRVIGVKATWRRRADERLFPLLVVAGERTQGLQDVELRCPPAHAGDARAEMRADAFHRLWHHRPDSVVGVVYEVSLCQRGIPENPTPRTRSRVTRAIEKFIGRSIHVGRTVSQRKARVRLFKYFLLCE